MEIIVRATVVYFFLWAVARGTGKRELSQMTAFELILLVTMGDLIQQGVTQEDTSLIGASLAVGTMAGWILLFSVLGHRFGRLRPVLDGVPLVVVRDGKVIEEALKLERFTMDELKEEARGQGIADLGDVALGVMEPDGRMSFIKSQEGDDDQLGSQKKSVS